MKIILNENVTLNTLEGYYRVGGGQLGYSKPKDSISVNIDKRGVQVIDHGEGMNLQTILTKYLIPREAEASPLKFLGKRDR